MGASASLFAGGLAAALVVFFASGSWVGPFGSPGPGLSCGSAWAQSGDPDDEAENEAHSEANDEGFGGQPTERPDGADGADDRFRDETNNSPDPWDTVGQRFRQPADDPSSIGQDPTGDIETPATGAADNDRRRASGAPEPFAQDAEPGWIPIRHALRPATLAEGLFRLDFFVNGAFVDRKDPIAELYAGTGYGISDNFEIGGALIRVQISPADETGLLDPFAYVRYRLFSGPFQMAVEAQIQVPTNSKFAFAGSVPMQLALGRWARIDIRPSIEGAQRPDWVGVWDVNAAVSFQLMDRLRIYAGSRVSDGVAGPVEPVLQPRGGVVYTFVDGRHPIGDLEVELQGPAERLRGDRSVFRGPGTDWLVLIAYRPFIRLPTARRADPFADPDGW